MDTIFSQIVPDFMTGFKFDIITVCAGILILGFILMAYDRIQDLLGEYMSEIKDRGDVNRLSEKFDAEGAGDLVRYRRMSNKYRGTATGDLYASKYKEKFKEYKGDIGGEQW